MTSKIKVDNINKVSDDSNIIKKCGTTITLGASGDSIALASGASQTGFGRTGTVDWQTGSIKTATFTAVSGEGYFVNTTGGVVTVNLPAGVAGAIVAVSDYAGTAATNNISISANGAEKIESGTSDASIYENRDAITLVYVDAVQGWVPVNNNEKSSILPPEFIVASSPCVSTIGDFKIHKFTGPGTFTVSAGGNSAGSNTVDYMVVAGGGGGGHDRAGGGGGGGFRLASSLPVTAQAYGIVIGAGGTYNPGNNGNSGSVSTFSTITSAGGGGGGRSGSVGSNGGSGGGGGSSPPSAPGSAGGAGNTPPVSPPQGNNGGTGAGPNSPITTDTRSGGGGGGGSAVGGNAVTGSYPGSGAGGPGGAGGDASPIFGSNPQPFYGPTNGIYSGGGGGSGRIPGASPAPGGTGGGGRGATPGVSAGAGFTNAGGGGGGGDGCGGAGGDGGSGIVLIRYKFQ